MQYQIEGGSLPVAIIDLEPGESLLSESGGRTWMRGDIEVQTTSNGGVGKAIGRMFSGESLFMSRYSARSHAQLAFASCFPGSIVVKELAAGESIICQKRAFMVATEQVDLSIFFQKKMGAGFFGGEGFIMQKVTGPGLVFLEIDGHAVTYSLAPGERIVCDTGVVALMEATCTMNVETVKGIKNMAFGGEGIFNTVVTGPGAVTLQSMSLSTMSALLAPGK